MSNNKRPTYTATEVAWLLVWSFILACIVCAIIKH